MASYSASLFASSFPIKIVPYVPRAPKLKPKSKAKSIATNNTIEHSYSGAGSSNDDEGWFYIDDFPLDPAVPAPFEAPDASKPLDYGISCLLIVTNQ